jgi:uncharacterized Zn finger protein
MAVVLNGAVIVKEAGNMIYFRRKCEKCGATESSSAVVTILKQSRMSTSFRCSKCGNIQKLVITN